MRFVVDLESNGLLHEMDRVHCIVLRDIDTGEVHSHADGLRSLFYRFIKSSVSN